ncbi:MAG TPA: glycoside hydrolase N-terminal domain-containing protein [Sunxiuqinia sp.]|nr:glycoside hydrolase N-terminal domain-containing protein [Sunxiuqinia sp.]
MIYLKEKQILVPVFLFLISLCSCQNQNQEKHQDIKLWYNKPASMWEEALPIGNGRLGAMVYGIPGEEHLQFNEETLWDCGPRQYQRKDANKYLGKIRKLVFAGKQDEAEKLANKVFMGKRAYEDEFPTLKKQWVDSLLQLGKVKQGVKFDFDDSKWPNMFMDYKSVWERKGLPDMNGSVLFRKTINIPADWVGKPLIIDFGHIKDQDFSYINGKLFGSKDEANTDRTYTIPAKLAKPGKNVIAVLINNYVSTGGFNAVRTGAKKMNIIPKGKKAEPLYIEGNWKYEVIDTDPPFYPQYEADYQPFGDLKIKFDGQDSVQHFRRDLDLSKALAHVSYELDGVTYKREYLASHPDNLIAAHFTANKSGKISFRAFLDSPHPIHSTHKVDDHTLALNLKVEDGVMKGTAYLNVTADGGKVEVDDKGITVSGANDATLKLVAATNFVNYHDVSGNPIHHCNDYLSAVQNESYSTIKAKHLADYTPIFNRFSIDLGGKDKTQQPTDQRILNEESAPDNDLAATFVQYARYLMLSSGREGTHPPNLQGIWNEDIYPAWGSKYTTNINLEMNFWPVEPLNIAECQYSLFDFMDSLAVEGAKTAKDYYNARGWMLHHNTDEWLGTAPINNANHGIWVTGGAWLCHDLWEHYRYSQDTTFLRNEAYPLIKGAAQFFVDFLVKDPKTGYLISAPSNSPEHGGLVAGPAMDHQIIRSLFKIVLKCSQILNTDQDFAAVVKSKLDNIAPDQIGKHGQLQEWMEDIDNIHDHHRHVSHLWGVYPGNEITYDKTPKLMDAAKQSLIYRGDAGTGWSLAWKINLWARFLNGDHAEKMIQMLLSSAVDPTRKSSGGCYPNLFDAHPPFQIDGNFGGAAGIVEMLMQSHEGYIDLLPALPKAWPNGSIKGLRARGGFVLDFAWNNGKLTSLKVKSTAGEPLHLKYNEKDLKQKTEKGKTYAFDQI